MSRDSLIMLEKLIFLQKNIIMDLKRTHFKICLNFKDNK